MSVCEIFILGRYCNFICFISFDINVIILIPGGSTRRHFHKLNTFIFSKHANNAYDVMVLSWQGSTCTVPATRGCWEPAISVQSTAPVVYINTLLQLSHIHSSYKSAAISSGVLLHAAACSSIGATTRQFLTCGTAPDAMRLVIRLLCNIYIVLLLLGEAGARLYMSAHGICCARLEYCVALYALPITSAATFALEGTKKKR
jgi:hypothetical protein